jgi:acetyl esterase/lipase
MVRMSLRASTFRPGLVLALFLSAFALALSPLAHAQETILPLWPTGTPEPPQTTEPEADVTKPTDALIDGHRTERLANVTHPTMSVYLPHGHNNGAAALVFPGGGYVRLAWTGEGTDACKWLNSIGVACLLVKYRVPEEGHYPDNPADLEDAQQAMRLAREHAHEWHIDPTRIGVIGFSAGGNLAVLLSTHPDDTHVLGTPAASEVNPRISARADFAIIGYPAYLQGDPSFTTLNPVYTPNQFTPPTFLIQAENDRTYGHNALLYYRGLMDGHAIAELHYFATGGHGFGVSPVGGPEENWTLLADTFLHYIHMIPNEGGGVSPAQSGGANTGGAPAQVPCPTTQEPPPPGRPDAAQQNPAGQAAQTGPPCW